MRLLKTAEVRDILDKLDQNEISFSKMVDMLNEIAFTKLSNDNTFKNICEKQIGQSRQRMQDKIKRELNFNNMLYGTK